MLYLWLIAGLVQGCLSGDLYPASSVSSVEAHGPLARLALQPQYGHVAAYHHVPAVAHVPLVAQPAHVYHQVSTVAQEPVLKYTSQPQYVQRLVDVTNTQVAVAKLQVRRPAVQKQFYDIEERTIVRPVGSAVLELEQPVSKQFVSPFSVVPAGHHTLAQFHRPLLYPVGSYPLVSYGPLQIPVQHYPSAPIQQNPQYPITSQPPQQAPPVSQPPQQYPPNFQPPQEYPLNPQPPQLYPPNSQPPQQYPPNSQPPQQYPPTSQPPQQYPPTSQPPQQAPSIPQLDNKEPQTPQQFPFLPQMSSDASLNTEFDSSDTVVVENPDFTKSTKSNDESQQDDTDEDPFDQLLRDLAKDQNENTRKNTEEDRVAKNMISDFENLQLLRMFSSQAGNEKPLQRSQQTPNFHVLLQPPHVLEQSQERSSEGIRSSQRSKEAALGDSHILTQTENSVETSSALSNKITSSSTTERGLPTLYRSYLNYLRGDEIAASYLQSTGEVISSARNASPDESQENQRKLLELLTGGGEVSEVAKSGESVVRGRVVSVTTAPCAEGEERVNTRRVVVSRPGHTVEEVHVQRPFTQLTRVAVHEPIHTHIAYH